MTIKAQLKTFLQKTFDIRSGEYSRASLMQLNIFLIISTLLVIKPTVNGLFISEVGVENLPKAFLLVAVFAAIISTIYARLLLRISLNRLMIGTLIISVTCLILFGLLLRFNLSSHLVLYIFYVWSAIFAVLSASQFWILANMVFNAREAKRLFGFIGIGAISGGIFGGYLTSVLASFFDSEYLLFVGAALLMICIPITHRIWKKYVQPNLTIYERKKKKTIIGEHPFKLIKKSKHLTFLASIIGVSVIVAKLVDYQFSAIAAEKISDPDELTAFFGFWFSNFNILSLVVQIFLTRRVVGRLGVGNSLFFLPLGILLGAFSLLFIPELWAAILIKTSDAGLKQSINKSAVELLALPIPVEVKNQTKTFIDVFIDSIATGIGGLMLIFILDGLALSTSAVSLLIIGLILIWLFFIKKIQAEYLRSFKLKIAQADTDSGIPNFDFTPDTSILSGLQKVLASGTTPQLLYALKKTRQLQDERLFDAIYPLLKHQDDQVRAAALDNLYFLKKQRIPALEAESLIKDRDQNVKIKAFEYLIEHSPENLIVLMNQYLNDSDPTISSAALISLAIETRDNPVLKDQFHLEKRIEKLLTELYTLEDEEQRKFKKLTILKAIGHASISNQLLIIEQFFKDSDIDIKNQAILSAGQTLNQTFINPLVQFLADDSTKENAAIALGNYGQAILPILSNFAQDGDTTKETLYHIPLVMERIGKQQSVDMLFQLMDSTNSSVRLAALRSLNELKETFPYLDYRNQKVIPEILEEAKIFQKTLSVFYVQTNAINTKHSEDKVAEMAAIRQLLIRLLEQKLDRNLERIFRLLGLKYSAKDVLSIYESIQSQQEDLRINAIEFLDNLLEPGLKKILIPIAETTLLETITEEAVRNLEVEIPSEYDCFKILLEGQNPEIKVVVGRLIRALGEIRYLELLRR